METTAGGDYPRYRGRSLFPFPTGDCHRLRRRRRPPAAAKKRAPPPRSESSRRRHRPGAGGGLAPPPPPPPPSPRRRHLPRPPQNDVIPEVVPPRDHDPSHQPLLVVGPAPREGAAGVHELGTGGGEEPTAEGGGRADAVLVEVGRARAEPWPRHGRWMEWRWDADDDDDEMG
jgi:hypothetical protein